MYKPVRGPPGLKSTDFYLSDEVLDTIYNEFAAKKTNLTEAFAQKIAGKTEKEIDAIAKEMYGEFGRDLMKRTIELGEKYQDRTYVVVKEAAKKTGRLAFPHIPQRFLEIMYTGIQQKLEYLRIVENNAWNLAFKIEEAECEVWDALKGKCGEKIAGLMPCKYACLSASETLYNDLKMNVHVSMEASMAKNGYCQFAAKNLAMKTPMPTESPARLER